MEFAPVPDLVRAVARGDLIILVDDPDRENEGDLVMAAEHADPEKIGFMAKFGRGLICAPISPEIADGLALPMMTETPSDPSECAFTISVDARDGITTGISAFDRALTARLLADPSTRPNDLKRPGHLFPLRADPRGVVARPGHTEAAVDLARLAKLAPAGVICEVMNDDGTMARLPDLLELAARENLLVGTIADVAAYRREHDPRTPAYDSRHGVRGISSASLPTPFGVFETFLFRSRRGEEILAMVLGDVSAAGAEGEPVLTRVHSECFTGDVLGSLRCDCGGQLQQALQRIGEEGLGLVIYLPQEGRGIGLAHKLEAYRLQDAGFDTVEANEELGFPADLRSYEDAAAVLHAFGVGRVRLLTNNPAKIDGLRKHAIEIVERVPVETGPGPVNYGYLQTKKKKLGHLFRAV